MQKQLLELLSLAEKAVLGAAITLGIKTHDVEVPSPTVVCQCSVGKAYAVVISNRRETSFVPNSQIILFRIHVMMEKSSISCKF